MNFAVLPFEDPIPPFLLAILKKNYHNMAETLIISGSGSW
jgi:hypothetical protein